MLDFVTENKWYFIGGAVALVGGIYLLTRKSGKPVDGFGATTSHRIRPLEDYASGIKVMAREMLGYLDNMKGSVYYYRRGEGSENLTPGQRDYMASIAADVGAIRRNVEQVRASAKSLERKTSKLATL